MFDQVILFIFISIILISNFTQLVFISIVNNHLKDYKNDDDYPNLDKAHSTTLWVTTLSWIVLILIIGVVILFAIPEIGGIIIFIPFIEHHSEFIELIIMLLSVGLTIPFFVINILILIEVKKSGLKDDNIKTIRNFLIAGISIGIINFLLLFGYFIVKIVEKLKSKKEKEKKKENKKKVIGDLKKIIKDKDKK